MFVIMKKKAPRRSNHKKNCYWGREGEKTAVNRRKSLKLGCLNVDGWSDQSKHDVLLAIESRNLDIFSVIETHRKTGDDESRNKLKVKGFDVFECRRKQEDKKGGGIACLVKNSSGVIAREYAPEIIEKELKYVSRERLWVLCESQQQKTAICSIYIACQGDHHLQWNRGIYEVLSKEVVVLREKGYRCVLQGDFNGHVGSDLRYGGIPGNVPSRPNENGLMFLNFLKQNNLTHLNGAVKEEGNWASRLSRGLWTRHSYDYSSSTILDYVVISAEHIGDAQEMYIDQEGLYAGASDHCMIFSSFSDRFLSTRHGPSSPKQTWDYERADWTKFKQTVDREIEMLSNCGPGVDKLSDGLANALLKGLNEGIGKKIVIPQTSKVYPRHIVNLLKERKELEKQLKTLKCQFATSRRQAPPPSILVAKNKLDAKTDELEDAKVKFSRQRRAPLLGLARNRTRRGRKLFWNFVSQKSKKAGDLPPLQEKETGILKQEPGDISKIVQEYLKEIFSGSDENPWTNQDQRLQKGPYFKAVQDRSQLQEEDKEGAAVTHQEEEGPDLVRGQQGHLHQEGDTFSSHDHDYGIKRDARLPKPGTGVDVNSNPAGFLDKDITENEVKEIVKELKAGKACGHDGVSNEALKNAPNSFIHNLTTLFNRVKNQSKVPNSWLRGKVTLVHKKGARSDVGNYRPITVLTAFNAVYSKIMNSRLTEVVERHRLLGEVQHGFRKGRSGADASFVLYTTLLKSKAKKKKPHLAFLDLQKAYDSIDRDILWKKMRALGFGGKFLQSLQSMYQGDYVTSDVNGTTTSAVFLGRGLRQGCSLSPLLFALYVVNMSRELVASNLGIELHRIIVSCIFFADDIILLSNTVEGLLELQAIVQHHCNDLNMKLSIKKSKIMSYCERDWEVRDGDEVLGCLEQVMEYKYLGVTTNLCPGKANKSMQTRALTLAKSYKSSCLSIARDGPDIVDLAMSLWSNIGLPSILFGCETVNFSDQAILEISRHQSNIAKFTLGLPSCAPNVSGAIILGLKPFKQLLFSAQLKFYVRLSLQGNDRWSKQALLEHLHGGWQSPYLRLLNNIRQEVNMTRMPASDKHVEVTLNYHFHEKTLAEVKRLCLPALEPPAKRARMSHVNESSESQVGLCQCYNLFTS